MKYVFRSPGFRSSRQSSALIIALFFLSLGSILLVGFITSMRSDVFSSRLHLRGVEATLYAQMGTDVAVSHLREMTGTNRSWISLPGRLIVSAPLTIQPMNLTNELSSGKVSASASDVVAANLNPSRLGSLSQYLLFTDSTPMRVRWIYVRKDGMIDTNAPPAFQASNPVIGRYAYWVDDNSARININTAWMRTAANTNSPAHPSFVNLAALASFPPSAPNDTYNFRLQNHFFNATEELAGVSSEISSALKQNKLGLTFYNHSPDMNMFGEPRIVLTTRQSAAGAGNTNFINIVSSGDPGLISNINGTSLSAVLSRIQTQLTRTDWPFLPGKSFAQKYSPTAPTRVTQIALNIVEYVRAAESALPQIEPIRGDWVGGIFRLHPVGSGYLGNIRGPRITEMGIYVAPTISFGTYFAGTFRVELHLPEKFGLDSVDLTQYWLDTLYSGTGIPLKEDIVRITAAKVVGGDTTLRQGEYRTITQDVKIITSSRPTELLIRVAIDKDGTVSSPRYDLAPFFGPGLKYPVDSGATPSAISSYSVADPCVNKHTNDWVYQNAANTFGQINNVVAPVTTGAQQDTDASGNFARDGAQFPAPSGAATNSSGLVQSVAELGAVHTGVECSVGRGTPWRTVRLQPQKSGSTTLPDWALLDLFSAPMFVPTADAPFVQPDAQCIGGRINVNAAVSTFVDDSGQISVIRTTPLSALFLGARRSETTTVDSALSSALALNVINRVLATGSNSGINYGGFYYTPAQMAELAGVCDSGEAGEILLRDVVDLASVRGNVFSIYSVGQTLKQDNSGTIHPQAEQRNETVVERILQGGTVRYQTVYSGEMRP